MSMYRPVLLALFMCTADVACGQTPTTMSTQPSASVASPGTGDAIRSGETRPGHPWTDREQRDWDDFVAAETMAAACRVAFRSPWMTRIPWSPVDGKGCADRTLYGRRGETIPHRGADAKPGVVDRRDLPKQIPGHPGMAAEQGRPALQQRSASAARRSVMNARSVAEACRLAFASGWVAKLGWTAFEGKACVIPGTAPEQQSPCGLNGQSTGYNDGCFEDSYPYYYEEELASGAIQHWECCVPIDALLSNSFRCAGSDCDSIDSVIDIPVYNSGNPKISDCMLLHPTSSEPWYVPACRPAAQTAEGFEHGREE